VVYFRMSSVSCLSTLIILTLCFLVEYFHVSAWPDCQMETMLSVFRLLIHSFICCQTCQHDILLNRC